TSGEKTRGCARCRGLIWGCAGAGAVGLTQAGYGQPPKPTVEQLREAAGTGDAKAQTELAYRLWNGDGAAADWAEALKLFRQAADKGYPPAQYALGFRMDKGQGAAQDAAHAAELYARLASRGYPPAIREAAVAF